MKFAIDFSAVFTRKKFWLIMSQKFWNHFTIFDHPVCSNPNKAGHQIYHFMKGHHYILQAPRSVIVFIWSSFTKKSQGTKYGDQNVHFFDVTPYMIFTHPVFLCLYWHIWHTWNISFPTIYNFMGVKHTHYKLCSVQSKLVYFSQFWGMKHFLGPVCDIQPTAPTI